MQPTVTHCDQGFGPNICIIAEVTSADVTLQNHAATIIRLGYSNRSDVYVLEKMRESATLLLTAEITSPAGLRTVLHHGGSWNNDVTFEPQPWPDQMLDSLIKYLSAPGNYPTSAWLFDGHCKTGC